MMADQKIEIQLPPDKSIFHRLLFLSALSEQAVIIPIVEEIASDVRSTIGALQSLGVEISQVAENLVINGIGKNGFRKPLLPIDCGNSGTTARFLMGILAAQSFNSELIGDASLSNRPMKRLADILNRSLGANIECSESGGLPV